MARAVRYGNAASETSSRVSGARMSRARGPHSAKHTRPEVMSLSEHAPIVRQVPAEPRQVVLPDTRSR